ncbi:hypothetical protein KUTeg_009616 [Tegillarca granosa]|uniref:C2H2-type domain-containing protein n=1 Tax=Tegillarca granosa TaxID=220873 RepID=A0ABQ9F4E1_TEGGR|nr:hypothetical protein KUTeg_009616 [Tegillarca granosa]
MYCPKLSCTMTNATSWMLYANRLHKFLKINISRNAVLNMQERPLLFVKNLDFHKIVLSLINFKIHKLVYELGAFCPVFSLYFLLHKLQSTNVKLITRSTSKKSVGHRQIVNFLENLSKDKDGAPVRWTFTKSGIHKAKGVRKKIALRVARKVEKIPTAKKVLVKNKTSLNVKDSEKTKYNKKGKLKPETMSDSTPKKDNNEDSPVDNVQNINSEPQSETSLDSKPPDVVKKRKVGRPKIKKDEETNEISKKGETNDNVDKTTSESAESNENVNVKKDPEKPNERSEPNGEVIVKRGRGRPRKNPSWTVLQKKMYSNVLKKAVNSGKKTHLNDNEDNYDSSSSSVVSNVDSQRKKVYKSYNRQGIKLGPRKMLRSQDNLITRQKRGGGASISGPGGRRKRTLSGEFELLEGPKDLNECKKVSDSSNTSSSKCNQLTFEEKYSNKPGDSNSVEKRKRGRPKQTHTMPNKELKPDSVTSTERPPIPLSPEVIVKRSLKIVGPGGVKFTKAIKDVKNSSSSEISDKNETNEFQVQVSDISKKLSEAISQKTDAKETPLLSYSTKTKSSNSTNLLSDEKMETEVLDKSDIYQSLTDKSLGMLVDGTALPESRLEGQTAHSEYKQLHLNKDDKNYVNNDDNENFVPVNECLQDIDHNHFVNIVQNQENKVCAFYFPMQNQKTDLLDTENQKTDKGISDTSTMKNETNMPNKPISNATEQMSMQFEVSKDLNLDKEIEHDIKKNDYASSMEVSTSTGKDSQTEINVEPSVSMQQLKTNSDSDKEQSEIKTKNDLYEYISKPVLSDSNLTSDKISDEQLLISSNESFSKNNVPANAYDSEHVHNADLGSSIDDKISNKYGIDVQKLKNDETITKQDNSAEKIQDEFFYELSNNKNNNNLSLSDRKDSLNSIIGLQEQSSVSTASKDEQIHYVAGKINISDSEHFNLSQDNLESQESCLSKDNVTYSNEDNAENFKKTSTKRVFQLRQKASRSPLEIIAMRQSQEERQYILEQTRRALRREEKQRKMRNKFQNMLTEGIMEKDQECLRSGYSSLDVNSICKPCSVVLIDFVKYLKDTQNSDGGDGGYTDDDTEAVDTEEEDNNSNFTISGNVVMETENNIYPDENIGSLDYACEHVPSKKPVIKTDGRRKRRPSARKQIKSYPSATKLTAEIMPSNEEENQSPTTVPPLRLKITGQDILSRNTVPPLKLKLNQKTVAKGRVGRPDKGTAIIRKRKARKGMSPVKSINPLTEMEKIANNSNVLINPLVHTDKPRFEGSFVKFINDNDIPSDSNVLSNTTKIRETDNSEDTSNSNVKTIEDLGKTILRSNELINSVERIKQQEQGDTCESDFICNTCDFVTSKRNIMESHIYVHLKNVPFKCVYCQRTFRSRGVAFIHMRSVHPDQEAKMETAEDIDEHDFYREVAKTSIVEPQTVSHKQPALTSQTVPIEQHITGQTNAGIAAQNKSVEPKTILQRHTGISNLQQTPEQHTFIQPNAGVPTPNTSVDQRTIVQTNLQQSPDSLIISVVLPRNVTESSGRYCCSYCSFTAASQQDILDHINSHHRHDIQYTCSLCDKAVFGYKEGIAQHFADVHPNKPVMYKSMPDFYDRKSTANEKSNTGGSQDKGNIFERMSDLFSNTPQQHNASESVSDHFMEKRTSLLREKTSAEADSTTADSDEVVPSNAENEQVLNDKVMPVNSTVHQTANAEKVYRDRENTTIGITPDEFIGKEVDGIEELAKIYGGALNQTDATCGSNIVEGLTELATSIQNSSVQSTVESSDVIDQNSTSNVDDNAVENDMGLKIVDVVSLRDSNHGAFPGASWGEQDLNQTITQSEQVVQKDTVIRSNDRPSLSVPLNIPKPKEVGSVPQASSVSNAPKTGERMGTTYKCERCCVHAPMLSIMVEHLRSSHRDINRLFLCPFCRQYEGSTEPDIHRHIKQFHNNPNQKSPPVALSSAAKKHLRTIQVPVGDTVKVTDGKPVIDKDIYKCLKCMKHMPSLDYIYDHLEKDHNEVFVYVCPDCKKFRAKEEEVVYNHIKTDHNKTTDNIILSLAIEENLFTRVQSLMKEKHAKPSVNKNMSGQPHSGQPHQSNQQTVIKQTPQMNVPRQNINQHDVIVVGESNKIGSVLGKQQPQHRLPIAMPGQIMQPGMLPVSSQNIHSGLSQQGFVNRPPPPAHALQGHISVNQIQSKSALRKSRPVQIRQNVPDPNMLNPLAMPNRTANMNSNNVQRYQHISQSLSQSQSPQTLMSQSCPPPLMRGPPPLLRFDPINNSTSIATTVISSEQQQRTDSISQHPQGNSSVRNTSFSMTDKLQRLHKPGSVGPTQSPEPGTSPSGRPLLKVPSVTPVLGGARSLTPQNPNSSKYAQSRPLSDQESSGTSTPLDLSKNLGQVKPTSSPVDKQPVNEEAEELSPDAFQIFNLRPSAPTPPNRLPAPTNVGPPYPFQRMGTQQMRPIGRMQQPLQANMPQRLPNQMLQNRPQRQPVFIQRGVVRRPYQTPTSNVNNMTNVPVYQSSPSSFPRQVTPPPSNAAQQNVATNMADMQVFKCPYCPNVVPLGIGEVAQHIEKFHPGHSIMFMKRDS